MNNSSFLTLPVDGGQLAYEVAGSGPLVLCIPGMGDTRASYRFLAPALVEAGYQVAVVDLRGHGDSSTSFPSYDNDANAADVEALIAHLGGPAVIIGNSMGAAISVLVAAERPELVGGLVLVGPFVRNGKVSPVMKALMALALARPFVAATWKSYYPSLNKGRVPADFEHYRAAITAAITAPGHAAAVSRTMKTDHNSAERALDRVHTPVLVVMGELDPDFPSPSGEAEWITQQLGGEILMVAEAAHYPHSQRPDLVAPAIASFLTTTTKHA
jgi:pimeloyl-ACP methyl ester carboxylesterase